MQEQATLPHHEAAILGRLITPEENSFSPAAAKAILTLGYAKTDKERMQQLAAKAREGTLSSQELAEVEAYSRIGSLLGVLKSKARRALKGRTSNGKKSH
jgi:hypothetical protein